jgi:diacylglycerol kinase (ATP)
MRNKFLGTGQPGFHPLRKIKVAISGIRYAVFYDFAVAYKVVLSIVILGICFYNRKWLDFSLIMVSTAMMIVSEMFNTAVEALCDFIETAENEKIRVIKDIAAAATVISITVWFFILAGEIWSLL